MMMPKQKYWLYGILILAVIGIVLISGCIGPIATPESIVSEFLDSIITEDWNSAFAHMIDGQGNPPTEEYKQWAKSQVKKNPISSYEIKEVVNYGEIPIPYRLEGTIFSDGKIVTLVTVQKETQNQESGSFIVVKHAGEWKILMQPLEKYHLEKVFVPDVEHYGDLIIDGTETMLIEDANYFQQGNVFISDEAKLIIKNSQFMLGRGDIPTIHTNIIVTGSLEIENSTIFPESGTEQKMGALAVVSVGGKGGGKGKVNITNSPTQIHLLVVHDNAQVTMTNSEMIFDIGGLLQIHGGSTKLVNSTIGALGLTVPANSHLNISGLKSGVCFESWDIHNMIPDANYNVILENSCILKDDFKGELEHGPFERGWLFFLDSDAHVRISDSELRKAFVDLKNEDVKFENLRIGIPSSLKYRDIELKNITMMGQWPVGLTGSNVTISNSDYLFLQPSGPSTLTLVNSHMVEFIPRDFFGTMIFENSSWTNAGEIIGGEPTHSMENNFTIKGSLKIGPELRKHLQWKDAQVTREYDVIIKDENGNTTEGALIKINGETFVSDNTGKVKFSLILNEFNYNKPKKLEVFEGNDLIAQKEIDFFTETPVIIIK